MIQCSLLAFVSLSFPVSLSLSYCRPEMNLLITQPLSSLFSFWWNLWWYTWPSPLQGLLVCAYVVFLSLHIYSTHKMTTDLMHRLVKPAEGECVCVHIQTCSFKNAHESVHITNLKYNSCCLDFQMNPKEYKSFSMFCNFINWIQTPAQKSWLHISGGRSTDIF